MVSEFGFQGLGLWCIGLGFGKSKIVMLWGWVQLDVRGWVLGLSAWKFGLGFGFGV